MDQSDEVICSHLYHNMGLWYTGPLTELHGHMEGSIRIHLTCIALFIRIIDTVLNSAMRRNTMGGKETGAILYIQIFRIPLI